ncbi:electron transfer flavoprotein alpha subunit [Kribbella sp. VKM Ac-2527]|uniref:Electron transfer flavoprotein small subunit n=1 Tax=Kribbella caucasensis TaxID=2512215 RepID=A0A4R6K9S4_9ACTN|nr:FAD-binding protein [Kribbella sp. VKM Ac-2527]TDO45692.1 electron transfer flavoprotein alpha subunit [Kribbella sp. VKM Ac-2527]
MRPLRVTVLVKQVPKGDHSGRLDAEGRLERTGAVTEMNPWCRRAVAQAVRLARETGGRSTAITMGPPAAVDVLRESLAWGIDDAVQLSDPVLAGSDCLVTARALAGLVDRADLVLVGASSVDGSTGAVGAMIAELLGLPFAGPVLTIEPEDDGTTIRVRAVVQRDDGRESVVVQLPAVLAVAERSCPPVKVPVEEWSSADSVRRVTTAALAPGTWGLAGSPTKVNGVQPVGLTREPVIFRGTPSIQAGRAITELLTRGCFDRLNLATTQDEVVPEPLAAPSGRGPEVVLLAGPGPEAGTRALLGAAAVLAAEVSGSVTAVTAGRATEQLFGWGADSVVLLGGDAPRPVAAALAEWMAGTSPWAVLGAALPWDREVLARLAVASGAGLMSDLISLTSRRNDGPVPRLTGLKPSGGGVLAKIVSSGSPQIATVRTGLLPLRKPRAPRVHRHYELTVPPDPAIVWTDRRTGHEGDALDRADVVIGVGRGVDPTQYEALEPIRRLLGAELAATRKVTDEGWMPHGRQLGITGRSVAPRMYVAVGLSGNQNHLVGASRAGTVLAINTDPAAEIFAHCDVGLVADWREVMPHLVDALQEHAIR